METNPDTAGSPRDSTAFLLAQLGAHAADRFAQRLGECELTPPLAGVLRMLYAESGLSQQALAARLGMAPSRVVTFVDDLEHRGWVRRERGASDRRVNVITLTVDGVQALHELGKLAMEHDRALTEGLEEGERETLHELLGKLATERGLTPGVHPGFSKLPG